MQNHEAGMGQLWTSTGNYEPTSNSTGAVPANHQVDNVIQSPPSNSSADPVDSAILALGPAVSKDSQPSIVPSEDEQKRPGSSVTQAPNEGTDSTSGCNNSSNDGTIATNLADQARSSCEKFRPSYNIPGASHGASCSTPPTGPRSSTAQVEATNFAARCSVSNGSQPPFVARAPLRYKPGPTHHAMASGRGRGLDAIPEHRTPPPPPQHHFDPNIYPFDITPLNTVCNFDNMLGVREQILTNAVILFLAVVRAHREAYPSLPLTDAFHVAALPIRLVNAHGQWFGGYKAYVACRPLQASLQQTDQYGQMRWEWQQILSTAPNKSYSCHRDAYFALCLLSGQLLARTEYCRVGWINPVDAENVDGLGIVHRGYAGA